MSRSEPYRCPRCVEERSYTGLLRFEGDPPPRCRNHDPEVEMEPVEKEKDDRRVQVR